MNKFEFDTLAREYIGETGKLSVWAQSSGKLKSLWRPNGAARPTEFDKRLIQQGRAVIAQQNRDGLDELPRELLFDEGEVK